MLTPAQAAFLAGLPQRPSGFNPYRECRRRHARASASCCAGWRPPGPIGADDSRQALAERLTFAPDAGAVCRAALRGDGARGGGGSCGRHASRPRSTARLQADVAGILARHRADLRAHGAFNVAVVVLDNATRRMAWRGKGRATTSTPRTAAPSTGRVTLRQPGSALKPFTYALAFDGGTSPATVLADVPSSFPTAEAGVVYSPRNYDGRYRGPLLARQALAGSVNVPAVGAGRRARACRTCCASCARAGLTTFDKTAAHYGLGLTLGNAEVRLDELDRGVRGLRARRRVDPADVPAARAGTRRCPTRTRLVSDRARLLDHRHPRRSGVARVRLRPRRQPRTAVPGGREDRHVAGVSTTTGPSATRATPPWACGWATSTARPLRNSSGVTGAGPIFHAVMLAAETRLAGGVAVMADGAIVAPPVDRSRARGVRRVGRHGQCVVSAQAPRMGGRRAAGPAVQLASPGRRRPAHVPAGRRSTPGRASRDGAWTARRPAAPDVALASRRSAPCRRDPRGRAPAALRHREPAGRRHLSHRPDAAPRVPDAAAARGGGRRLRIEWRVGGRIDGHAAGRGAASSGRSRPARTASRPSTSAGRSASATVIVR